MKKHLSLLCTITLSLVLLYVAKPLSAQNTAITDESSYTADESAVLDIYSANKGLLIPRVDTADITDPATGLFVYDSVDAAFYFYAGTKWIPVSSGQIFQQSADTVFLGNDKTRLGIGTSSPMSRLSVKGSPTDPGAPLFDVTNSSGDTIFAIYENEVRVNFIEDNSKATGAKGGFAVGGLSGTKSTPTDYLRITPDSIRIYIDTSSTKGAKGGFAVGGLSGTKSAGTKFFTINQDSARIYLDNSAKGAKGGFAVGGLSGTKSSMEEYLRITRDSARIYLNNNAKGAKGGFAVGGLSSSKAVGESYLNVDVGTPQEINPSEPRILFYPNKNALLAGNIIIEDPDDVGQNSVAMGYENVARGDYSQAFGFHARALGDNSTAIGNYAEANGNNSFAFGDSAISKKDYNYAIGKYAFADSLHSYALGYKAGATGRGSYALGSPIEDTLAILLGTERNTHAAGDYSFALGMGTVADSMGAFALGALAMASNQVAFSIGTMTNSSGLASLAMGHSSEASGDFSLAIGRADTARDFNSIAIGNKCVADNSSSVAIGYENVSTGEFATAFGRNTYSHGDYGTTMGYKTKTDSTSNYATAMGWKTRAGGYASTATGYLTYAQGDFSYAGGFSSSSFGDYTFATGYKMVCMGNFSLGIGLGTDPDTIFNANTMAIMGGKVGIGTVSPDKLLHVAGDARIEGDIYYSTGSDTYNKPDYVFNNNYKSKFSINQVEKFIQKNKHLPWVTPAEKEENGINLTRMSFETLETVENLQLQVIELHKQNQLQKQKIHALEKNIENLKTRNDQLKNKIQTVSQNRHTMQQQKEIETLQKESEKMKKMLHEIKEQLKN